MRIYVAGKYSADTEEERLENVNAAMDAGLQLMLKGHQPFVPVLSHWMDKRAQEALGLYFPWEVWMESVSAFVPHCEGFLYLSSSKGADIELFIARATGKTIFYSVDDVPVAV